MAKLMKSVFDIKARDIMMSDFVFVSPDEKVHKVLALMDRNDIHNVLVFDGKEYKGFFGYKQLVKLYRRLPLQTKIRDYLFRPPKIAPGTNLVEIVDFMYRLNYKILPVSGNGSISGVVSESDIINAVLSIDELQGKKVREFMTPSPFSIREGDNIGTAVSVLREKNVSRLPVLDKEGKVSGVLESIDVIKKMTQRQEFGRDLETTSRGTVSTKESSSFAIDHVSSSGINVSALVRKNPVTTLPGDDIAGRLDELRNRKFSTIIVVDATKKPIGIVSPKDVIQYLAKFRETDNVYIQVSGLDDVIHITGFQKSEVHRIIDTTVKKMSSFLDIDSFTVHLKTYHQSDARGKDIKYVCRCKTNTSLGLFASCSWDWDIIDACSKLMEHLERQIIRHKDKLATKGRNRNRHAKEMGKEL